MKKSDSIASLAAALAAAQGEFKTVAFDADNPHFKSKFASLPATVESVRATLAKYKLAVVQGSTVPETNEGVLVGFGVETTLIHASGEWISNVVVVPVEKPTAQGAGSGLTYGRRYGLQALLCLVSDDDDGESATNHPQVARQTARPAPTAAPAASSAPKAPSAPYTGPKGAGPRLMPFGKNKGKPLSEMSLDDLASAQTWCMDKDADKFADLIKDLSQEMMYKGGKPRPAPENDFEAPLPPEPEDSLPF